MDDWTLKWLNRNYCSTNYGFALSYMVQYIQRNQLNYRRLIIFGKSKMATSKMACLYYLASKHHFFPVVTFYQPLYWKATEIILD